ncbi:MAG: M2 family metallopeptidase, partial [Thermoanaerobaculia bacterium]
MSTTATIAPATAQPPAPQPSAPAGPTAEDAARFVADAENRLAAVNVEQQRAAWVAENFITYDTQVLAAKASEKQIALGVDLAKQAARFDHVAALSTDVSRKLGLI